MTYSRAVYLLSHAIMVAEGSNPAWNNPGDLTGADAGSFATCGTANSEGVLKFLNAEDGLNALYTKINRILAGKSHVYPLSMTFQALGHLYADGAPEWAQNVTRILQVPLDMTIGDWLKTQPDKM